MDSNTRDQNDPEHESNHALTRRVSSRISRRSIPHPVHPRPYPNSNYTQFQTWMTQNRQVERQRSYYSNYYASNRNNRVQISRVPSMPVSLNSSLPSAPQTSEAPTIVENIRINNAATQTNSATIAPEETRNSTTSDSSPAISTINVTNNPSYLFTTPLNDYIRTIGAFITYSGASGRPSTLVLNSGGNDNTNSSNVDIEPLLNLDTIFGFTENYFNDGLTKQEINRHTISYEYKPVISAKRKRVKAEENETATVSTSTAASPNENCSICLDKFNHNVQVRRLPCLHVFHIKCIDKWLKRNKKCPICRIAITINYETLISSLESGSSIDQCLSQQESSFRSQFRPTITLSLQSNRGNSEITVSGNIVHATVELNSDTSANTSSTTNTSTASTN